MRSSGARTSAGASSTRRAAAREAALYSDCISCAICVTIFGASSPSRIGARPLFNP
jgi:hypothetical protein